MRKFTTLLAMTFLMTVCSLERAHAGIAQDKSDQILDELRQIRQLLQELVKNTRSPQQPIDKLTLDIGNAPVLGKADAPVTIMEFTDYQCPFCQRFHLATFALLKRDYIDTGKVRFVSRDLPLVQLHPHALRAAQAARCAGDQGQFWQLRDQLQRSGDALELSNLLDYAGKLNLDVASFRTCVENEKYRKAVEQDTQQALAVGVNATPTFIIGKSTAAGVNGELVSGAVPYEIFTAKLKALLGE
jgi:protein-disulfide isomerase